MLPSFTCTILEEAIAKPDYCPPSTIVQTFICHNDHDINTNLASILSG